MKYQLASFFLLLVTATCFAQSGYYPRDTTYSLRSAYEKAKKNYPQIKLVQPQLPKCVQAHSNLVYAQLDGGRQLHLDVFSPKKKSKKKKPGILIIHGGGWTTGSKENMVPMAQQLAKKGYVAVTVEYRLSGEAPYPAAVQDLKTAVRWMRANAAEFGIDPEKIAAYGCSAGAHLASLLGTTNGLALFDRNGGSEIRNPKSEMTLYVKHPDHAQFSADVQAVLNIDGIVSFIHPDAEPEWTGRSANAWLDSYAENFDRWKEASPLEYAGENTPSFLFVNSSFSRFHAGRDDLIQILNGNGIYSEVHTFDGSPHGFWLFEPWFEPTLDYSVGFLKKIF